MDSFYLGGVRSEKDDAVARYRLLQNVTRLFRVGEACLILFFLSWISARFPFAIRISGEFFRRLFALAVSPIFVFLVGNAIVVTLLAKSGQFSPQNQAAEVPAADICEDIINTSGGGSEKVEVLFEDKQIICEENSVAPPPPDDRDALAPSDAVPEEAKVYRRSQSENLKREEHRGVLRRSETEIRGEMPSSGDDPPEKLYPEDDLSNEEFQRTIEAFIAKQLKFQREESSSIVPQNPVLNRPPHNFKKVEFKKKI